MEINLLTVNVGNTRVAFGAFVSGELKYVARAPLDQAGDAMVAAWNVVKDLEDVAIAGASVNPKVMESFEFQIGKITGSRVEWVGRDLDFPSDVKTDAPAETGVDRIVNVAAAYEQMEKACVVVDAGSAITIDCCDDTGAFLGGAIAPGVSMQLHALHERTAKLPLVKFEKPEGTYGRSTEQAIRQGVFHGIRGMVKEIVEAVLPWSSARGRTSSPPAVMRPSCLATGS